LKRQKNETTRTFAVKKRKHLPLNAPRLIYQAGTGRRQDQLQTKYGIELTASIRIVRVEAVILGAIFKYIYSLLEKETHD
jgi:hypothetical protein